MHAGEVVATLDGERTTVPAGGMVAVDPAVKRKFESAASPTTLIVVGAPVGRGLRGWRVGALARASG